LAERTIGSVQQALDSERRHPRNAIRYAASDHLDYTFVMKRPQGRG
jgi:hypothetical protein